MITKLDNPSKGESKDYNNKSSASRLSNYLTGNEEKIDKDDLFFNQKESNITKKTLVELLDKNVKGLTKDDHKFFSISINFSQEELEHIGNSKEKIKEFTIKAMENYASSLKGNITIDDLVWGAIIHEKRFITEKEAYLDKNKVLKAGNEKPGLQSHVHIIISANTTEQKKINALTAKNKVARNFNLRSFQYQNQISFDKSFNYKKGLILFEKYQVNKISKRVEGLYKKGIVVNTESIVQAGKKMNWDHSFYTNYNSALKLEFKGTKIDNLQDFILLGKEDYLAKYPNGLHDKPFIQRAPQYTEKDELTSLIEDIQREADKQPNIDNRNSNSNKKGKGKGKSRGFF